MKRFKNILVGIDLSEGDRFVSDDPAAPTQAAWDRALWLAESNAARLTLMYAIDASTLRLPDDEERLPQEIPDETTVCRRAGEVLSKLVDEAQRQGIEAERHVAIGKSWLELIRQVLRNDHDLLIAGTRRFGALKAMLFGSTGMKLLRQCPCPVWITQPNAEQIDSILVAHDLTPVGDLSLELGASMAEIHGSRLHVFHAIEYQEMDEMFPSKVSSETVADIRNKAAQHIARQLEAFQFSRPPAVHIEAGAAYSQILKLLEQHQIELLVMGTVARTGIAGLITGNTAERLLPHVPCSMLAVKPQEFKSPVTLA